jgi:hypothetical protein
MITMPTTVMEPPVALPRPMTPIAPPTTTLSQPTTLLSASSATLSGASTSMRPPPPGVVNATLISPEFFRKVNADVSHYIRRKLLSMDFDVADLELHNSSLSKTFRAYLTLKRAVNLKTLYLAERIMIEEIEKEFGFRPAAFYWRYAPDQSCPVGQS